MANVTTSAENHVITSSQMSRVREVDFVERFTGSSLAKLIQALGVTRKIPMMEGSTLYVYKTTGSLESGEVSEGEVIPLSQYSRTRTAVGDISLKKWRKATTVEAIKKAGYQEAVNETDLKLLRDVQASIRGDFFSFLTGLNGTVVGGDTLQAVLAKLWGNLQVLFENDSVETVYFIHPLTVAEYLSTATVTMQTAFGMNYIENFLGLGTVILHSSIPQGQVYATAKENLVLYYLAMNGDVAAAFGLTTDDTGYIGMHAAQNDRRAQVETLVMCGIQFLVEQADGVVVGMIDATPTLGSVTVTSAAGTATGQSKITLSGYTLGTGEGWVYKTAASVAPVVSYGQKLSWTELDSGDDITPAAGDGKIPVAAVDANGRAQAAGSATLVVRN